MVVTRAARRRRPTCRRSMAGCTRKSTGTLASGQVNTWSFTVTAALGGGELKAEIRTTSGDLLPRLTLSWATGQVLIQSDSDQIVQFLEPGVYLLTVSPEAGSGSLPPHDGIHPDEPCLLPRCLGGLAPPGWRRAT